MGESTVKLFTILPCQHVVRQINPPASSKYHVSGPLESKAAGAWRALRASRGQDHPNRAMHLLHRHAVSQHISCMQYVAKLSADNVVLMVKLKKAEARRDSLATEAAELRAAVDTQSGAWFEEVHAAVEAAQRESMKRADSLQVRTASR